MCDVDVVLMCVCGYTAKFRSGNPRIAPLEFHLKSQYQSSAQTDMVVALQLIIPPTTLNHFD